MNILYPINNKIKNIIHFGDVHIRQNKRKEEYKEVFDRFFSLIKGYNKDETIIVNTGDTFHTKLEMQPEGIKLSEILLRGCADLFPTILIAGNHDGNVQNKNRMDALSPIVDAINHPNLYYLKKSGLYGFGNILFNNWGVFDEIDDYILGKDIPQSYKNQYDYIIGLYHGMVNGATTDNGYVATSNITLPMMDYHDIFLLGDIHLYQTLQEYDKDENKPVVRFSSDLCQQNYGENLYGHGFSFWDLENRTYKHIEVPNDYGFLTLIVVDGKVEAGEPEFYPKKTKLRIQHLNTTETELKSILTNIRLKTDVIEYFGIKLDVESVSSVLSKEVVLKDTTQLDYQNQLITDYLKNKLGIIDEDLIKSVLEVNKEVNLTIEKEDFARNIKWKPKKFEWSNMFSYGENNIINFNNLKDVVGIFAKNKEGKSSIFSALSFCIWDKTERNYRAIDVLHSKKSSFHCKFNFEINGIDYYIEKNGISDKNRNIKVNVKFWKEENGKKTDLSGDDRFDTNSIIREYIGNYEDFILTSFSVQNGKNVNSFLDLGNTERKDLLSQFIGLTIFDKLYEKASGTFKELEKTLKLYRNDDFTKKLVDNKNDLYQNEIIYKNECDKFSSLSSEKELLQQKIAEESKKYIQTGLYNTPSIITETKNRLILENDIEKIKKSIETEKYKVESNKKSLVDIENSIKELENKDVISSYKEYQKVKNRIDEICNILNQKEIEVRYKLSKVKKADGYEYDPNCNFCLKNSNSVVKEAELAKTELNKDKIECDGLFKEKESLSNKLIILEWSVKSNDLYTKLLLCRNTSKDLVNSSENSLQQLNNNIKDNQIKLQKIEENIKLYNSFKNSIDNNQKIDNQIKEWKKEIQQIESESKIKHNSILQLNSRITLINSQIKDIDEKIQSAKEIEKKYKIYESYIKCINRDGISYNVISSVIPILEKETNTILNNIDDELQICFEADGKNIIPYIIENGLKRSINLASGFENFALSLSIRIALINICNLPKPVFYIQDEGFGSLDSNNLSNIELVFSSIKKHFDFIIIISHIDQIKDFVNNHIEIIKENGFSSVNFE
jgi:DNA repair exonuclease SbcCD ATPase subunit